MKRLFGIATASLLALSACNRTAPGTATNKDKPNDPPVARTPAPTGTTIPVVFTPSTRGLVSSEDVPLLEQIDRENTKVVAAATPSIVRITASRASDPRMQLFGDLPFHFRPGAPREIDQNEPAFGSGVIISKDGYIVTNNHVIEDASSVEVQLPDQRSFPARVVASDALVDVAVLKIDATDLPALPWGDSDKVQVGEEVFAIGNPFNLDDSVGKGIVSAKGRNLPDSNSYEDYIQTDAAINRGNSGGALVNIHGELIGINAAIASTSGGNMGVGFSIPSNLVRYAVEGLLKDGKLVRGYLGVQLPVSVDEGVTQQLGLESDRGALLAGIQHASPADRAQLHSVDFITAVDGHKIDSVAQLRLIVAQIPVGKEVVVNYIRAGAPRTTTVKISELPKDAGQEYSPSAFPTSRGNLAIPVSEDVPPQVDNVLNGLSVADLNDKTRRRFGVEDMVTSGVVITGVQEGSPAEAKGILPGDVIEVACARHASIQPLTSAGDFTSLSKNLKADQGVVLLVHHGKSSGFEDKASSFVYLEPFSK